MSEKCVCKSLWLNDNKIRHDGAKSLSKALMQNKTLTALYLNYNNIGDLGLQHLLTALKSNDTLLKLELGACSIGELEDGEKNNAATMVMAALNSNKKIEHIGLFGNHDNMERRHAHNSPWVARSHPTEPPACLGPPFWARERRVLAAWMPMIRGVAVALSWCRCPRRVGAEEVPAQSTSHDLTLPFDRAGG